MFYATCEGVCRVTQRDMKDIEASLSLQARQRVGFVLVTLDPARDTVAALRSYRRASDLSQNRWMLLRGDADSTSRLASLLGVAAGQDRLGRFIHSSELVILDKTGRILHHHEGVRADLAGIAREVEFAVLGAKGGS